MSDTQYLPMDVRVTNRNERVVMVKVLRPGDLMDKHGAHELSPGASVDLSVPLRGCLWAFATESEAA